MKNSNTLYSEVDIKAGVCNRCEKDIFYQRYNNRVYKDLLEWNCVCMAVGAKCKFDSLIKSGKTCKICRGYGVNEENTPCLNCGGECVQRKSSG